MKTTVKCDGKKCCCIGEFQQNRIALNRSFTLSIPFASYLKHVGGNIFFTMCCLFRQQILLAHFFSYINEQLQAQEVPFFFGSAV